MDYDYTNKVLMVTGAAGNLGQAAAAAFLQSGADLALVDHGRGRLEKIFSTWEHSRQVLYLPGMDLANPEHAARAAASTLERYGRIDILVNTVGGYRAGTSVHETTPEDWEFMFSLNVRTAFLISRAVIPAMLEQKSGKIILIAAAAGLKGSARHAAYSASKSVVIRLTESMAAELKPHGVNANCLLPTAMDSPANRQSMPSADFSKWLQPESVARVILFLASEGAKDLHGAAIPL